MYTLKGNRCLDNFDYKCENIFSIKILRYFKHSFTILSTINCIWDGTFPLIVSGIGETNHCPLIETNEKIIIDEQSPNYLFYPGTRKFTIKKHRLFIGDYSLMSGEIELRGKFIDGKPVFPWIVYFDSNMMALINEIGDLDNWVKSHLNMVYERYNYCLKKNEFRNHYKCHLIL